MPAPRPLTFATVADAPAEADRLRAGGYLRRGKWDLGQICEHLADWMGFALDGFPPTPTLLKPVFWAARHTIAPRTLRKALDSGGMAAGVPTDPRTVHPPAPDPAAEAEAVARLRTVAERFLAHEGEYAVSPLFGRLTREQCRRMHAIHCAHHLGFLEPKG